MRVRRRDPRGSWLFSSVDYASVELSTLAQCCINLGFQSRMADAINAKQDLHTRLACRWIGITYEEGMRRKKARDPQILDLRQNAKPVNFGKPGLMGPPKMVFTARKDGVYFCEGAGLSKPGECYKNEKVTEYGQGRGHRRISPTCSVCLTLAVQYSEGWYEEWPEMHDYHAVTVRVAQEGEKGIPIDSFGTGMQRLESNPNAVSNHLFQNLAAQGAKEAGWLITKEAYTDRKSVLYNNLRIGVFVHDETIAEVREAVAHEAAWRQAELMLQGIRPLTPDVDIQAEPALMRRLFKGAELAEDVNEWLKPWWPTDPKCEWKPHTPRPAQHVPGCKCWAWAPDQELMSADMAA